jgi:hypothetical protein
MAVVVNGKQVAASVIDAMKTASHTLQDKRELARENPTAGISRISA